MKTKLFLLLLALSVLRTQAQSLSIKGRVTDASQEAVIAANVSLWTIDSTLVTGVTSDAQGKFTLHKIKAGDYRLSISFIGLQSENILLKLNKSLDLGDVQLQEDAVSLGEVTVSASNVLQRVDRQIILPSESQLKRSFGAYDLLNNLGIARLQVDNLSNSMSVSGGGSVQTRINGIKVTDKEIAAVRAKDVLRVEFIEDPGKQYGDDELGAVVNIILRRRETGGVVNFQLSDSPHTLWGENFLSAKFNYKNSEWGIDYFNKNGKYHSRLESHETFYLGDRTIDRIKEGIEDESPSLSFINNLNLTYNLTKADKYVFNAIFRNNLSNAPYQNELNKMWAVGSTESIYSYVNNHTSSYSPALDLYFQHTLPHQQSIQVNVTGTLIHTKNNRKYKEYKDENAPLADIQTLVDGDKRSVIGEAIYEKNFKEVKLSGGARHYQMRTENEYKGSNPTTSKMDQSQTSAFFEVQGKGKDFRMLFFPEQCRHCELAPCMTASTIDGAIVQDEKTGAVLFTPLTAQLDGQAVREACPYDIPRVDPQTKQIHKCDFCNDRVHQGMLPACVLSCPTGCMNFGEREDMENLAEQRLAEVKERFPNAVLGDNGIVHVIYLYAEDPNLYHKFAVFAQNDANPMTRRQLFAKLRRPVA